MNERDLAKRITRHLNHGVNQLDRSVLLRLQSARQQALALHAQPQRAMTLALSHGMTDEHHESGRYFSLRYLIPLAGILLALAIAFGWQTAYDDSAADVDATLLSAELPPHAYLDSDFEKWLEQSSRR